MSLTAPLRLHHVGYAVHEIEPVATNYVSRYGYQVVTPIIHDPQQTALVQFLQLNGDRNYLEFVSPDGPGSKLSGAVKRRGALNHLCYTSGPLESEIEHLEEHGMKLISTLDPGVAFAGRRICWLLGEDGVPIELVERRADDDFCTPGTSCSAG
jgi:methylmalonyl-CoA/ethylmalonyl-CoA epimerase